MALGRAFSVAVRGLDGVIVEIEADITSGLPGVHLVGLPDAALQESRDRVRAAITNCGNTWPMSRLTLALSPATLPKTGSLYDIAIAAAILSANSKKPWDRLKKTVLMGELALDGRVRPVRGVLPAVLDSLTASYPGMDWAGLVRLMPGRVRRHGLRRAAEMRECAAMLREAGLSGDLAEAIATRHETFAGSPPVMNGKA